MRDLLERVLPALGGALALRTLVEPDHVGAREGLAFHNSLEIIFLMSHRPQQPALQIHVRPDLLPLHLLLQRLHLLHTSLFPSPSLLLLASLLQHRQRTSRCLLRAIPRRHKPRPPTCMDSPSYRLRHLRIAELWLAPRLARLSRVSRFSHKYILFQQQAIRHALALWFMPGG